MKTLLSKKLIKIKKKEKLGFKRKFKKNLFFYLITLVFLLLVFELILSIGGYFYFYGYSNLGSPKIEGGDFRILFLGESTTAGDSRVGEGNAYPDQIERVLQQKYPDKKIKSYNKGFGGIETKAILRNLDKNMIKYKPNLVIFMAGSNENCSPDKPILDSNTHLKKLYSRLKIYRLITLIKDLYKLSSVVGVDGDFRYVQPSEGKDMYILRLPYYSYKPFSSPTCSQVVFNLNSIVQTVQSYGTDIWFAGYLQPDARETINPLLKKIAEENNIIYIGDYPKIDFISNHSLFVDDGWHPNKEGHKIIAEKIAENIIKEGILDRYGQ